MFPAHFEWFLHIWLLCQSRCGGSVFLYLTFHFSTGKRISFDNPNLYQETPSSVFFLLVSAMFYSTHSLNFCRMGLFIIASSAQIPWPLLNGTEFHANHNCHVNRVNPHPGRRLSDCRFQTPVIACTFYWYRFPTSGPLWRAWNWTKVKN